MINVSSNSIESPNENMIELKEKNRYVHLYTYPPRFVVYHAIWVEIFCVTICSLKFKAKVDLIESLKMYMLPTVYFHAGLLIGS